MSQPYTPAPRPARLARAVLLAAWAALTAGAVGFVVAFGSNAPYADEWEFVPALLGREPAGPWLWAQHNEHRLPLPRAVYLALFKLTHDFRAGMLLQVGMLSALSLGLMALAARLRGRPAWPDAFFPVSLLHLGHWENFVMGYQLCFALFTVLVTGLVVVALRATRETAFRSGVAAGTLNLLLVLTGGAGLAVAPPVCAWVVYLAAAEWRAGRRGRAAVLIGLAVLPPAYCVPYFTGYEHPPHHPPTSSDPVAVARVAAEGLAMAAAPGAPPVWAVVFAAEVVLGLATVRLLVGGPGGDRTSAFGLAAVAAGVVLLVLAVGHGRAAMGPGMGLWSRYGLLTWPLLGAAYLVWVRAGREAVPMLMCFAASLAFVPNTGTGMAVGSAVRAGYDRIRADVRAGVPVAALVDRHLKGTGQEGRAARGIPMLREAGVGVFAGK
ncbi:MAG: hypothetical protein C0501_12205 [Isosphaera sp.]|nr:hypothetical protein [Isosphaera sp.]